jgi:hypothetical protein
MSSTAHTTIFKKHPSRHLMTHPHTLLSWLYRYKSFPINTAVKSEMKVTVCDLDL